MTRELEFYPPVQAVRNIFFSNNHLNIDCIFYISRLKNQNDFDVKAYLYNGNKKILLDIDKHRSKELTSKRGYRFSRHPLRIVKYDYSNCAYQIRINLLDKEVIECLDSTCFIEIEYNNDFIHKTFILGKSDSDSLNLIQYHRQDCGLISTHLMNDGNLQIKKDSHIFEIKDMLVSGQMIEFKGLEHLEFRGHHNQYESSNSTFDLSLLNEGIYDVYSRENRLSLDGDSLKVIIGDKTLFMENNLYGYLQVKVYHTPIIVKDLQYNDKQIILLLEYPKSFRNSIRKIVLSNKTYNYDIRVVSQNIQVIGDTVKARYILDMDSAEIKNNLASEHII